MSVDCFRLSPPQRQHTFPADHRVIHAVARSPIDPQFAYTLSQGLAVAKVPCGEPVDSARNLRLGPGISQLRQPVVEDIFPGAADVMTNLDHTSIVTYKSHRANRF